MKQDSEELLEEGRAPDDVALKNVESDNSSDEELVESCKKLTVTALSAGEGGGLVHVDPTNGEYRVDSPLTAIISRLSLATIAAGGSHT